MRRLLPGVLALLAACASPDESRKTSSPPTLPAFMPAGGPDGIPASPQESSPTVRSVPRPDPLLIPGDLLLISVHRHQDLALEVRIPQDGRITFPMIGAVPAASSTTAALEGLIRAKLEKDFLQEASVTVTVKEYAKRRVYIVGGVTKPDGYEILPDGRLTVMQVIAMAGGFTDRAYKEFVQIVRRRGTDREVIRLSLRDVERLVARGQAEADVELWPDDLVVVPSAVRVAYVLGAVSKPGQVEVPNDARVTVSMAVSQAGSYTKFASTGRVQVLRQTPGGEIRKVTVDLDAVLNGRLDQDVELQPGDVVWVPERGLF